MMEMNGFTLALVVLGVILAVAALPVVYRMIVGPTILDRAVATDMLVVMAVLGMALYTSHAAAPWAGPAMLGLTGTAFIATVTVARFVARESAPPPMRRARPGTSDTARKREHQPYSSTETGQFSSIRPDHEVRTALAEDRRREGHGDQGVTR